MAYSLTSRKPKELLATDTKLWWVFIGGLLLVFLAIKLTIWIHTAGVEKRTMLHHEQREQYETRQLDIETQIAFVQEQVMLAERTRARNRVIQDSLMNLFELIPEQIYLDSMTITEKSLNVRGHAPSKEIFNFMLRPPLESIFGRVEVSFYPAGGGWYSFDALCTSQEAIIYATP